MIQSLIVYLSIVNGFDPDVALSIARIESNLNPYAIGALNEQGLFQIRYNNINQSGVIPNILRGIAMLKETKLKCKHKLHNSFVVCFNYGISGGSKTISPMNTKYYKKFKKELAIVRKESNGYKNILERERRIASVEGAICFRR